MGPFLALDARSSSGLHERHLAVARFLIENNANVKAENRRGCPARLLRQCYLGIRAKSTAFGLTLFQNLQQFSVKIQHTHTQNYSRIPGILTFIHR